MPPSLEAMIRSPLREEWTERYVVGEGRAVPEPPLRGRLVERSHVTGDDEGRPYGGRDERRSILRGRFIIIVVIYDTFEAGEIDSVGRAYYNGR